MPGSGRGGLNETQRVVREQMRMLARLLRSPRAIFILAVDRFLVPLSLRLSGVPLTSDCKFFGKPVVRLAPGARIELGRNLLVNSRYDSNVAGLPFPTILAAIAPDSRITIGDGTGISGASIVARKKVTIGKRVMVGAGVCIWDTDFHPIDPEKRLEHPTRDAASAPINIDDDVFIGARALILKGVNIGKRAVIGAGAVITRDVAPGAIVIGNPAQVVGSV